MDLQTAARPLERVAQKLHRLRFRVLFHERSAPVAERKPVESGEESALVSPAKFGSESVEAVPIELAETGSSAQELEELKAYLLKLTNEEKQDLVAFMKAH